MKALIIRYTIGLLIIFGLLSPAAGAEVRVSINYVYFPVTHLPGKSVAEMIIQSTPLVSDSGHRPVGQAKWQIRFDKMTFSQPRIGVCRIMEPRVTCSCEVTLPQLKGGDEPTQREFDKVVAETREHELEHCRIAAKHADELEQTFKNLKAYDCDDMSKVLRETYEKAVEDCSVDQKRFDHAEYGYNQYLYLEYLQSMRDAGFNLAPPAKGRTTPRTDSQKRSMTVVPQGVDELKQEGIYKDENGVWRNY